MKDEWASLLSNSPGLMEAFEENNGTEAVEPNITEKPLENIEQGLGEFSTSEGLTR